METLVVIVVLVGVVVLVGRVRRSNRSDGPAQPEPTFKPSPPKNRSAQVRKIQPSRFNEKSAKHLRHKRILTGPAWVTDGDTIRIKNTQIRLFGVDAPELNHPYGKKAKWALHKLCKGHAIRAEITDEDDHGRTVAKCYLPDGRDLSAEMVKQGLAIDWAKFSGGKYRSFETPDARKKLFLADARQKGRMHVWEKFEGKQGKQ